VRSQSSHPAITLPAAAAQAQRCCAVPVRPYPCTAIHWHRRTGQRQLTAPGTGRRLLPCHTSAKQLRNDSSHHQALAVARRQRQLATRTTGTGPSGVGTQHQPSICSGRRLSILLHPSSICCTSEQLLRQRTPSSRAPSVQ
jgi:hypothetical protein